MERELDLTDLKAVTLTVYIIRHVLHMYICNSQVINVSLIQQSATMSFKVHRNTKIIFKKMFRAISFWDFKGE